MSDSYVVDSSIGVSWVHPDQVTPESQRLLEELEVGGAVVVPLLWFAEVANSLLVLQRRKKITAADRKAALTTLTDLHLEVDEESAWAAFGRTSELAEKYALTVYDATYLEVAIRRSAALASRDEALRKAAKACGVSVR